MISRVGTVSLFVSDQDRAKEFYTRILGLNYADAPSVAPNRWVAVAPKSGH
jgi:catechol 2,3-dioxygenase-like lactoylglutathione lyase family enzyme